jgi:hypothetical protein
MSLWPMSELLGIVGGHMSLRPMSELLGIVDGKESCPTHQHVHLPTSSNNKESACP